MPGNVPPSPHPPGPPARPRETRSLASTPDQAFISYAKADRTTAFAVCGALEAAGIACWIAPRNILPGQDYGEAIVEGINRSGTFVLILSSSADASPQVKREIERASSKDARIIPFRIEDFELSKSMEYFISASHWLDAVAPPLDDHLNTLVRTLQPQRPNAAIPTAEDSGGQRQRSQAAGPPRTEVRQSGGPEQDAWRRALLDGTLRVEIPCGQTSRIATLDRLYKEELSRRGYRQTDVQMASVVLWELLANVEQHAGLTNPDAGLTLSVYDDGTEIAVRDTGQGFDLDETLRAAVARVESGEREHGLVKALRFGTRLDQTTDDGNVIQWFRAARPKSLASQFGERPNVAHVVYDIDSQWIRIADEFFRLDEILRFRASDSKPRQGHYPSSRLLHYTFFPLRQRCHRCNVVCIEVTGLAKTIDVSFVVFLSLFEPYLFESLPKLDTVAIIVRSCAETSASVRSYCEPSSAPDKWHTRHPDKIRLYSDAAEVAELLGVDWQPCRAESPWLDPADTHAGFPASGGPRGASLRIQDGLPNGPQHIPLEEGLSILGRGKACDILLSHPMLSRRHAAIVFERNVWYLKDLDSVNGTVLNGAPVHGLCPLADGDEIRLADLVLMFRQR